MYYFNALKLLEQQSLNFDNFWKACHNVFWIPINKYPWLPLQHLIAPQLSQHAKKKNAFFCNNDATRYLDGATQNSAGFFIVYLFGE